MDQEGVGLPLFGPPDIDALSDGRDLQGLTKALRYRKRDVAGRSSAVVRSSAARALGEIGDPRTSDALVAALDDESSDVRLNAAHALERLGGPRAVEALTKALRDDDSRVYRSAALALESNGEPSAVDALLEAVAYGYGDVRLCAAASLARLGDARAVEPLVAACWGSDTQRFKSAIGRFGDALVLPALVAMLANEDEWLRTHAACMLGELGDVRAVEPLVAVLEDESSQVRLYAARALGELGDARAIAPLIAALADEPRGWKLGWTRSTAAWALETCGDVRAVEPLIEILASRASPGVTDTSDNVVPIVAALTAILKRHHSSVDASALRHIVELGDIWIREQYMDRDEPIRYEKLDCSDVQQLAVQELLRRGAGA